MLLISTVAGNTGWVNLFEHHPAYAGRLPNYTAAAGGRSFPSSAGFNTTEFFFTDDSGVYFLPTRDMTPVPNDGGVDLKAWTEAHRARIVKLADGLGLGAGGLDRPRLAGALVWIRPVWRLGAAIRAMALTLAPMLGVMLYRTILTAAERPKVFWYVTVAMLPLNALGNQVPMPGFGRFRLLGQPGPAFRHSVLPLPSV